MTLDAGRCPDGHLTYPRHPRCPDCGAPQTDRVDLSTHTGRVVTWTTSTATPPGVREPNTLAVVEFSVGGTPVRVLGQTAAAVEMGDRVEPVPVDELRDPDAGIRDARSQGWSGHRFRPVG